MFAAAILVSQLAQAQVPAPPAGIVLPRGAVSAPAVTNGGTDMTFHGGPVQHDQKVFTIFWNPTTSPFPAGYQDTINQFVADLDNSDYYGVASQYADFDGNISRHVTFGGTWTDTSTPYPSTALSFGDLLNEVARARTAMGWPADSSSYFQIYTAPGIGSSGGSNLCGLHWFSTAPVGQILYPWSGCFPGGTTPNEAATDAAINVSAHEILETVTDPGGSAWFYNNAAGEIADLCAWQFGARGADGGNITLNGHRYILQLEWSNATSSCVLGFDVTASPPSIIQQPSSQVAPVNFMLNLWAAAAGLPTTTAQWQVSSDGGATFSNVPGATSGRFSFTTTKADNGKRFRAVFTNASGTATTSVAVVTVTWPPSVTSQPSSRSVTAGQPVSFTAAASASPAASVQWQVSASGSTTFSNIAGATSTTYTFTAAAGDDGKRFRAVFTNGYGSATTNAALLTVTGPASPPSVTTHPADATVVPGTVATFTAAASGQPEPTVAWEYSLDDGATWNAIAGATASSYSFTASTADTGRRFRARFTNASGAQASAPATLAVSGDVPLSAAIDGDGKSDLVVWRRSTGTWYWLTSGSGFDPARSGAKQWGNAGLGDVPLLADLDGDGKADLVVWRASSGTWFWLTSRSGYDYASSRQVQWGNASLGDVPVTGDFDGDGRADLAVWRASSGAWFWLTAASGYAYANGAMRQPTDAQPGDLPLAGDLDGDGRDDLVLWRPSTGTWSWLTSSSSFTSGSSVQWGSAALLDARFLKDADGDGRADLIVWRPSTGTWYMLASSSGYAYASATAHQWGAGTLGDTPLAIDADGDARADFTVWRPANGTWYWLTSSDQYAKGFARQWGSRQ